MSLQEQHGRAHCLLPQGPPPFPQCATWTTAALSLSVVLFDVQVLELQKIKSGLLALFTLNVVRVPFKKIFVLLAVADDKRTLKVDLAHASRHTVSHFPLVAASSPTQAFVSLDHCLTNWELLHVFQPRRVSGAALELSHLHSQGVHLTAKNEAYTETRSPLSLAGRWPSWVLVKESQSCSESAWK